MKLSIIIVNWNTRDYLLNALASIGKAPPDFDYETIVVDNASADGSSVTVAQAYPQVRLLVNKENAGYAKGNNQGVAISSGEFVLFLNPDVVVHDGALETAVHILETHPEAAALGIKLLNPDGSIQKSLRGFPTPAAVIWEALGLSRLFPRSRFFGAYRMTWFGYDRELEVDQPMGTFLLVRSTVLKEIGVLDEQFPIFFNEVDWCRRAKLRGWKILFSPDATITHYGAGATKQVGKKMAWESRSGLLKYYRKHYPSPLFAPVYWLTCTASWVQARIISRRREV